MVEQFFLPILIHFLENHQRVVAVQFRDRIGGPFQAEHLEHMLADRFVQLGEDFRIKNIANDENQLLAVVAAQTFQQVGEIGIMKIGDQIMHAPGIACLHGIDDNRFQPRRIGNDVCFDGWLIGVFDVAFCHTFPACKRH